MTQRTFPKNRYLYVIKPKMVVIPAGVAKPFVTKFFVTHTVILFLVFGDIYTFSVTNHSD